MFGGRILANAVLGLLLALGVSACTATYRNHGYAPSEEELASLVVGVDTRATVDDAIGVPSSSGVLSGGNYYYVRSRFRHFGAYKPVAVERQVVAVSFDENDTIQNIERFDLADGKIVPISRRVTDSSVVGNGFLRQMLRNIGNIDPSQIFN